MRDLNEMSLPELWRELTSDGSLTRLLEAAREEDLKRLGDITSQSIIPKDRVADASVVARVGGVVAGLEIGPHLVPEGVRFRAAAHDGERCKAGETLAHVSGQLLHILGIERVLLNMIGRLSGIASLTRQYVDAVAGTGVAICDTRKTTPGMRTVEKYAVRCGGGTMHRVGLFDAVLYKDNHLAGIAPEDLASTLTDAIRSVRQENEVRFVEVEADSLDQFRELLRMEQGLIDIVLLDNMSTQQLREAVKLRDGSAPRLLLEASGGVNLKTVREIAATGVDRISVGALTHSAPALDVGLDIASLGN